MPAKSLDLYQAIGGTPACRKLSAAFYARVERDPILRPLFPGKTLRCATEEFAAFLVQFLGGPSEDSQHRWWLSLHESHLRFKIGQKQRNAWLNNMAQALDDVQLEEPLRTALHAFFERSSTYVINREQPSLAQDRAEPPADSLHQEIGRRWDTQRTLDQAVAAVRKGEADRAIALAETCDRTVFPGLLALMVGSGHSVLLGYVHEKVTRDPALVRERYAAGRTLLHAASAGGRLSTVELLLQLGADPNATDVGRHSPLYSVGNECRVSAGGDVVRALVRNGANVNAQDGVKRCTALHMAARRGNVAAAEALLDCGADIEARDSMGDTSLRRSVNCDKTEVASLLLAKGADMHSKGSKRLTPLLAARSSAMKRLLTSAAP